MARMMTSSTEAQKAQAVAAYTFVLSYVRTNNTPYSFTFPSFHPETDSNDKKILRCCGRCAGSQAAGSVRLHGSGAAL